MSKPVMDPWLASGHQNPTLEYERYDTVWRGSKNSYSHRLKKKKTYVQLYRR